MSLSLLDLKKFFNHAIIIQDESILDFEDYIGKFSGSHCQNLYENIKWNLIDFLRNIRHNEEIHFDDPEFISIMTSELMNKFHHVKTIDFIKALLNDIKSFGEQHCAILRKDILFIDKNHLHYLFSLKKWAILSMESTPTFQEGDTVQFFNFWFIVLPTSTFKKTQNTICHDKYLHLKIQSSRFEEFLFDTFPKLNQETQNYNSYISFLSSYPVIEDPRVQDKALKELNARIEFHKSQCLRMNPHDLPIILPRFLFDLAINIINLV